MNKHLFVTSFVALVLFISAAGAAPAAHADDCQFACQTSCTSAQSPVAGDCPAGLGGAAEVCCSSASQSSNPPAGSGNSNPPAGLGNPGTTLLNPLQGGASLESFLGDILKFVVRIGSIIVVLMLVYVGFLFVIARGNGDKLSEARQALLWTVVGALILLGAQAIAIGICETTNALSTGSVASCAF